MDLSSLHCCSVLRLFFSFHLKCVLQQVSPNYSHMTVHMSHMVFNSFCYMVKKYCKISVNIVKKLCIISGRASHHRALISLMLLNAHRAVDKYKYSKFHFIIE